METIQKQLLQEYMVFRPTPQQLKESVEKNNGALIVEGIIQKASNLMYCKYLN